MFTSHSSFSICTSSQEYNDYTVISITLHKAQEINFILNIINYYITVYSDKLVKKYLP